MAKGLLIASICKDWDFTARIPEFKIREITFRIASTRA